MVERPGIDTLREIEERTDIARCGSAGESDEQRCDRKGRRGPVRDGSDGCGAAVADANTDPVTGAPVIRPELRDRARRPDTTLRCIAAVPLTAGMVFLAEHDPRSRLTSAPHARGRGPPTRAVANSAACYSG